MDEPTRDLLIAWSLLPFLSPNRTRLILEFYDPPAAACRASAATLQGLLKLGSSQAELVRNPYRDGARRRVEALRGSVLTLVDPDYPTQLSHIIDPPLVLHYRGDLSLLQRPALAIVGSRRASPYAINVAQHLAGQLSPAGLTIVSGLARGVDAASHEAALDSGGSTIAVLGTGIDLVYPRSNLKLFKRIEGNGLIVTEFPPSTPPFKQNFPIRKRVISGLSLGAVIVEATGRSGSLITARTAVEQGREVFAVPGSIFAPGSEGTHRLIQYGAKLIHDVADIVEELKNPVTLAPPKREEPPEELRETLEAFQKDEASHIDAAASMLSKPIKALSEPLLQLELGGWLRALPGSRYVRVK